jgi:hypothetical protein
VEDEVEEVVVELAAVEVEGFEVLVVELDLAAELLDDLVEEAKEILEVDVDDEALDHTSRACPSGRKS